MWRIWFSRWFGWKKEDSRTLPKPEKYDQLPGFHAQRGPIDRHEKKYQSQTKAPASSGQTRRHERQQLPSEPKQNPLRWCTNSVQTDFTKMTKIRPDKRVVCDWKTNPRHKSFGGQSQNSVVHLVLLSVWLGNVMPRDGRTKPIWCDPQVKTRSQKPTAPKTRQKVAQKTD
jgi:hypothetical protein